MSVKQNILEEGEGHEECDLYIQLLLEQVHEGLSIDVFSFQMFSVDIPTHCRQLLDKFW